MLYFWSTPFGALQWQADHARHDVACCTSVAHMTANIANMAPEVYDVVFCYSIQFLTCLFVLKQAFSP